MAASTRKFKYSYTDANGNIRVSNENPNVGPSITPANQLSSQMANNVINSMVPSGKVQVGIAPGTDGTNIISGNLNTPGKPAVNRPLQQNTPGKPAVNVPLSTSAKVKTSGSAGYEYDPFSVSAETARYGRKLRAAEADKPDEFSSRYESQIQTILNGILNRKAFDLNSDPNYQTLYDQYSQQYMAQGDRAMRDQLGASAGLTGGYGSTAAQAAASQAYDNYMQQLNDRNLQLMDMAYGMYRDETADRYNQLGAVTDLDNVDYSRYRDTVGDYYRDLDYLSGRYDTGYNRDYSMWADNRDFDYGTFTNDRQYDMAADQASYGKYQDAMELAMKYATSGLTVPDYLTQSIASYQGIDPAEVAAQFATTQAEATAISASKGRSGGGSGRSRSSSGTEGDNDEPMNIIEAVRHARKEGEDVGVEALDEAYVNYYDNRIPASSAQGRAQALQQIIKEYMNLTGLTNKIKKGRMEYDHAMELVEEHFDAVLKAAKVKARDKNTTLTKMTK